MGNVNQYTNQAHGTPIEGILQGLQAVNTAFGIPTELARANLLREQGKGEAAKTGLTTAQTEKEQSSAAAQQIETDAIQRLQEKGEITPLQAVKMGMIPNSDGSVTPAPKGQQSPLGAFMVQPTGGGQPVAFSASPDYAMKLQGLKNAQTEGQIKEGEAANQATAQRIANMSPIAEAHDKFVSEAKDEINNIPLIQSAKAELSSGQPMQVKTAAATLNKIQGVYSKNSPESAEQARQATGLLAQWKQKYGEDLAGALDPADQAQIAAMIGTAEKYNTSSGLSKAAGVGSGYSAKAGIPAQTLAASVATPYFSAPAPQQQGSTPLAGSAKPVNPKYQAYMNKFIQNQGGSGGSNGSSQAAH